MRISQLFAGLALTAAGLTATVLPAAPAQATSLNNCTYWVLPANTNLSLKVCATGGQDTLDSTVWVTNKSATTSQFVQRLEVSSDLGAFNSCFINAWVPAGASRFCTAFAAYPTVPSNRFTWGKIHYWSPQQNQYVVAEHWTTAYVL
ncbi:hypothetical protein AB0M43_22015 [Longispora sp. NPDC051575]|uniref:hypothetical protein n=1 Tax=Longispora sp. NPDC051575 TaxID=3154943 RepID=UPI003449F40C